MTGRAWSHHPPCGCGCGQLADECAGPAPAVLGTMRVRPPGTWPHNLVLSALHARAERERALRPWRVGRKVGRTIYDADDVLIGVMDTPELAQYVVDAVNVRRSQ